MTLFFSKKSLLFGWILRFPEWLGPPFGVFSFEVMPLPAPISMSRPMRTSFRATLMTWHVPGREMRWRDGLGEWHSYGKKIRVVCFLGDLFFWWTLNFRQVLFLPVFMVGIFYGSSNRGLDSEWMEGSVVNSRDPPIFRPDTRKNVQVFNGWRLELPWVTHNPGFSETWVYLQ